MGQTHKQGNRSKMIDSLKKTGGKYFCNTNENWQSSDSLTTQDYKKILKDSIFVPCPKGNYSVDTFRLYEALEVGSIPIIEKSEYWKKILGKDHPLIECNGWENIHKDLKKLSENSAWVEEHTKKTQQWWTKYKSDLKSKIKKTTNPQEPILSKKQLQLINIADQWVSFKDHDFLHHASKQIATPLMPKDKFSVYNPGQKIAIVSLYTKEIADYAIYSEKNIREYCELQGYTFYVYRENLDLKTSANWSKAKALLNHIDSHEAIVWMDSDTIIFNPHKKIEDILRKCAPCKKIIGCQDIGSNNKNLPKGSTLNSGVLIFINHQYSKNILTKWLNFDGDKSSLYASGGDQEILCKILKQVDGFNFNTKIFPMNAFNTEPRMIDKDTFVVHFMAYPHHLKKIFLNYFCS